MRASTSVCAFIGALRACTCLYGLTTNRIFEFRGVNAIRVSAISGEIESGSRAISPRDIGEINRPIR